jgi:anion-transporting  ArsA/GET3 family ATPase
MPELLVSLLYNELKPEEIIEVKKHLKNCHACREAFSELQESTNMLEQWADEEPETSIYFVSEKKSIIGKLRNYLKNITVMRRFAYAIPAAICLTLVALSLFNFKAEKSNGNWNISFSLFPSAKQSESSLKFADQIDVNNQKTLQMVETMIRESELRQAEFYQQNMIKLASQIKLQRRKDLEMVGYGFADLQNSTHGQFKRTNKLIGDLIHLTGYTMEKK